MLVKLLTSPKFTLQNEKRLTQTLTLSFEMCLNEDRLIFICSSYENDYEDF